MQGQDVECGVSSKHRVNLDSHDGFMGEVSSKFKGRK